MSDISQGDGWWKASDEKWYAPNIHLRVAENWIQGPSGEWIAPQENRAAVSPGWWQATDGAWYPPTTHPQPPLAVPSPPLHDFDDNAGPVPAHQHLNGRGWVADTATVSDEAFVGPDASVFDYASITGRASITGTAWVCGNADVSGSAKVGGDAIVDGHARVTGFAQVTDSAVVSGTAQVDGTTKVDGTTRLGNELEADTPSTQIDQEGVEWRWDGHNWNCWVADQWVPVPGATPEGLVPVTKTDPNTEAAKSENGESCMSDTPVGPGSWIASDGRWYPAETHPDNRAMDSTAQVNSSETIQHELVEEVIEIPPRNGVTVVIPKIVPIDRHEERRLLLSIENPTIRLEEARNRLELAERQFGEIKAGMSAWIHQTQRFVVAMQAFKVLQGASGLTQSSGTVEDPQADMLQFFRDEFVDPESKASDALSDVSSKMGDLLEPSTKNFQFWRATVDDLEADPSGPLDAVHQLPS